MSETIDVVLGGAGVAFVIWPVVRALNRSEPWAIKLPVYLTMIVGAVIAAHVLFWITLA